jgi:hypothetical protein
VPEVPASGLGQQDGVIVVWGVWGCDDHKNYKFGMKFEFAIHQSTTPYVLICIKLADRYDCPVTGSLNQVGT